MVEFPELVDRIYEAAALPDLWPDVLADIGRFGGGEDAMIFTVVDGMQSYVGSPRISAEMPEFIAGGWVSRSERPQRILGRRHHGFVTDLDVFSMEEIERDPVYQEWLIPRGWGWGIGTSIPVPSGEQLFVTVERAWVRGPAGPAEVDRMDALRPHLARAALLSARLRRERAKAIASALDLVGLPAAVLNAHGRAVAMNAGCEALLGTTVRDGRRFTLLDQAAGRLFDAAMAALSGDGESGPASIPIRPQGETQAMVVHLLPVRRTARELFAAAVAIVVFTPLVRNPAAPDATLLAGLFDLSPGEARVAREIAMRRTVEQIAAHLGISRETVRSQLKNVFLKTGTNRQADLGALIAGGTLPGG